jgi:YgiT-type zinc finger domain-containing protein
LTDLRRNRPKDKERYENIREQHLPDMQGERDYLADVGGGQQLRIPNIEMEVCDKCGEEILSLETARKIDTAISDHRRRVSQG